jgi:hypothetical protein
MSTNDVPGFNAVNNDVLANGCWAEHEDGSLLLVQSTEGGRVVYMMFDLTTEPITEYRDAMPERGFKKAFSWNPKDKDSIKWTWHDKTPFPWDKVIQEGAKPGVHYATADDHISAAERIAMSRRLRAEDFDPEDHDHLVEKKVKGKTGRRIIKALQKVIDELRA